MQFLTISDSTTLAELSDRVGDRNVERMLAINGLTRTPRIGKQFRNNVNNIIQTNQSANWQRKSTVLNQFSSDSDIFETAALLDDNSWKVLSALETFPGMLKVPETVVLPSAVDILGNGQGVGSVIYNQVMIYASIALGQKHNNKVMYSVIYGVVLYNVTQILSVVILIPVMFLDPNYQKYINGTSISDFGLINGYLLFALFLSILFTVAYYILTVKVLDKKLNLE